MEKEFSCELRADRNEKRKTQGFGRLSRNHFRCATEIDFSILTIFFSDFFKQIYFVCRFLRKVKYRRHPL